MNIINLETKLCIMETPIFIQLEHMNYEVGRLIVKEGAEFGRDSVETSQMANFFADSGKTKNMETC